MLSHIKKYALSCQLTTRSPGVSIGAHMARKRHPGKEIEMALRYAESHGWLVVTGGHHAWGKMYCPKNLLMCRCGDFCLTCIWSSSKNVHHHARALRRVVDNCHYLKS